MKLHADLEVGVATHTGLQRSTNEDDFLLVAPTDDETVRQYGRLLVLADGMGGVVGGAEASRTAVRALAGSVMSAAADRDPTARMREGFAAACRKVFELSRQTPALREMGTTLTALNLLGDRLVLGHVGDSRALMLRRGELVRLSRDHAVREPDNFLTRCIGGGQETEEPDIATLELQDGDCLLLLTDGLWGTVPDAALIREVLGAPPQDAAERLVALANVAGGPDNSTAVIVRVRHTRGPEGEPRVVELPREESRAAVGVRAAPGRLTTPWWPWLVLVAALLVGIVGVGKLFWDRDLITELMLWWDS